MWNSLSVQNPNPGKRKIDTLLAPLAAAVTVTLLTFLQAWSEIAGDAGFVLVGFAAVWVRRFGPRGLALGNVALFGSLFSLFVKIEPSMLPACYAAMLLSGVVTFAVRFGLIADDPGWTLRVAFAAFCARARLVGRAPDRRLPHHQTWLNLNAVNVDELIAGPALEIPDLQRRELRTRLLAAELAVEQHENGAQQCEALHRRSTKRRARTARASATAKSRRSPTCRPIPAACRRRRVWPYRLRSGSSLAIVVGTLVPPHTWFWAVLTAFIVFNGTASAGEALRRTWSRVAGTAIGVGAGFILVDFVKGHPKIELGLSLVGVFLAMYVFRVSYGIMTFFVTATVAMIYDLVGRPTAQLLDARLVETIVGGLCGGAAATLVFPLRTHDVVDVTAHEFATRLRASIDSSLAKLGGLPADADALDAVRAFDIQFQQLVARLRRATAIPGSRTSGSPTRARCSTSRKRSPCSRGLWPIARSPRAEAPRTTASTWRDSETSSTPRSIPATH